MGIGLGHDSLDIRPEREAAKMRRNKIRCQGSTHLYFQRTMSKVTGQVWSTEKLPQTI